MLTRNLIALCWEAFTLQLPWYRQGLPHYAIIKKRIWVFAAVSCSFNSRIHLGATRLSGPGMMLALEMLESTALSPYLQTMHSAWGGRRRGGAVCPAEPPQQEQ